MSRVGHHIIFMLCCLLLVSCEEEQGKRILFYPLVNAYYDEDNKHFLVYDSSTGSWGKKEEQPEANMGRSVRIPQPAIPVYSTNSQHRLIYGTRLYSNKEALRKKFEEDSLASVPPPAPPKEEEKKKEKKEKEKSGFRKWLEKVFG